MQAARAAAAEGVAEAARAAAEKLVLAIVQQVLSLRPEAVAALLQSMSVSFCRSLLAYRTQLRPCMSTSITCLPGLSPMLVLICNGNKPGLCKGHTETTPVSEHLMPVYAWMHAGADLVPS